MIVESLLAQPRIRHFVFHRVVGITRYRTVREDFLRVYRTAYDISEVQTGFSDFTPQNLHTKTVIAGEKAVNYDPHKKVLQPFGIVRQLYWLIGVCLLFFGGVATAMGWLASDYILTLLNWHSTSLHVLVTGLPSAGIAALLIYIYFLQKNTVFVQEMNRELRIPPSRIHASGRNRPKLVSYYVWNSGLCSAKKLPVLCFMVLIRIISSRFYQVVIDTLIWALPQVFEGETRFWRLLGTLYVLIQFGRKDRRINV